MHPSFRPEGARVRRCGSPITRVVLVVVLVSAVLGWGGCRRSGRAVDRVGEAATKPGVAQGRPNVLLISMDTTRADYLACYGHPAIKTPNIDRLAAEGTLFEQCVSAVPITLPSHSSMMTGVYPYVHGVRDNGLFYLNPANVTLAEVLKEAGYATAAEVAAFVLDREFGMNQGFDVYNDIHVAKEADTDRAAWSRIERPAEEIADSAIERLRERADGPFFLFVHFFDAHHLPDAPKRFLDQYADRYIAAIAYMDEQIGRLMAEVKRLGLDQRTLVIVTGDHGEGRGQHHEETHAAFVYDTTLCVPLIFRYPGRIPAGRRVGAQVRLIDIAPTILDFLGLEPLPKAQGVSLMPLIEGRAKDPGLTAYGESLYCAYYLGYSPLRSLRAGGWKYILAPKPELYDLARDPGELRNLADEEPQRAAQMREALRHLVESSPVIVSADDAAKELSPDQVEALQALGYMATGAAGPRDLDQLEPSGPNPMDHADEIELANKAMGLERVGDRQAAERVLREILEKAGDRAKDLAWVNVSLAIVLTGEEKFEEAIPYYRRALDVLPEDGRALTNLGIALLMSGHVEEAIEAHEKALAVKPTFARTHHYAGNALAAGGRLADAVEQYQLAIEQDPKYAATHRDLAVVYLRLGRTEEAVASYQRAVELAPENKRYREELAWLLLGRGQPEAALDDLREVVTAEPDDVVARMGLAQAYRALGKTEEAIASFRRVLELDPRNVGAADGLGLLLLQQGRAAEAVAVLRAGLEAEPDHLNMLNKLAWLLATASDEGVRNGEEAVRIAERANGLAKKEDPKLLDTLAAAYAEAGRYEDAVATVDHAIEMAKQAGADGLVADMTARRDLYENGKPYRSR